MPAIPKLSEPKLRTGRAERSDQIKTHALELGFHKVGIVRPDALSNERIRLEEWLGRGFHGDMKWMARDSGQRTDQRKLFPQTRSVVVVALNYYTPHEHSDNSGKVSRYAWGDDY